MQVRDLTIQMTNRCNLNCPYCFAESNTSNNQLSIEQIKKAINIIKPNRVAFSGGEPMLRKDDIFLLLPYVYEHVGLPKKGIRIETNGTIPFDLNNLSVNGDVSMFQFNFSLDGFKDLNDKQRGNGTFDKVVEKIKECVERGYWTTIKSTFDDEILLNELDYVYDFAMFCRKELGLQRIRFGNIKNSGRGSSDVDESYVSIINQIRDNITSVSKRIMQETNYVSPDGSNFLTVAVCDSCPYTRNDLILTPSGVVNLECAFLNVPLCHYTKYTPELHEKGLNIMKTLDMGGKNNMRYDMSKRKTVFG